MSWPIPPNSVPTAARDSPRCPLVCSQHQYSRLLRPPTPKIDVESLMAEAVGKESVLEEVQRLVTFYTASKQEGRLRQHPEMDMLVLGNSGTGKTFVINLIHQLFLANGILTNPHLKKVDASEYNQWINSLSERGLDDMKGQLLVIDNCHLLMTDTEHITPIDRLMSMMEDWERDLSADWYTYPIVIFAGEKNQVEYYFQKKKSGRSRFTKMLELHDCSAQELHAICKRELSRRGFSVEGEADKKLLGYFRYLVKNRKLTFRNAYEATEKADSIYKCCLENGHTTQVESDDLRTLTLVDIAGDQAKANASTEELMHAFDKLIGAASAKKKMENLLNQIKLNRRRAELTHTPFQNLSICFAFIGHPDTGQKEFREAMTSVLSDIGIIEKDGMKTFFASDLFARIDGNTLTERRLIDEMLAQHGKTIYIIDANPQEWKQVEEQLPVLSEFINDRFVFDDYTPAELARLFTDYIRQMNMRLADDAQETLVGYFGSHAEGGRSEMKLLFNEVIFRQNTRLASATDISDDDLITIAKADIPTD